MRQTRHANSPTCSREYAGPFPSPVHYLPSAAAAAVLVLGFSGMAYFSVHSRAVARAASSSASHFSATLLSRGSSGLGELMRAWMDSSTVRICSTGDHLSLRMSRQMLCRRGGGGWGLRCWPRAGRVQLHVPPQSVHVHVVNLGQEAHLGRGHGVVFGKVQLQLEGAASVRRVRRPLHAHVEVPEVVHIGRGFNAFHCGGACRRAAWGMGGWAWAW